MVRDIVRPQVLVLDVDQPLRALQGLGVAPRDAALTTAGERVVPAAAQVGIGAQQLHRVGSARHGWRWIRLRRKRNRVRVQTSQPVAHAAQWGA